MYGFLKEHVPRGVAPLAGNSVHEDKRFLLKEMPKVVDHLHYRIVGKAKQGHIERSG